MRRLAVPALLALLAAGCGGSEKRLTRAEYVRRADAICTRYNDAVRKLPRPQTPSEIANYANKSLELLDDALDDERDVRPPAALEATKDRWLRQAHVVRDDIAQLRDAAKNAKVDEINRILAKGARDDAKANATAAQLGLKVCSKA